MFCGKCGKQIPDGSVCSCQQANQQYQAPQPQYQAPRAPKAPIALNNLFTIPLAKLASLGLLLLSGLFLFVDGWWWGVSSWGSTVRYSVLGVPGSGSAFDFSAALGVASIFAYLALICFFVLFVSEFINWSKLSPALAKVKKLIDVIYYGLYVFILLITFIGSIVSSWAGPSWALIFVLFIAGGGLALSIVQLVTKK